MSVTVFSVANVKYLPFMIRRLNDQGDVLNCDLTEANTTQLDPYNSRHFSQSSITDVYQLHYKNDGSFYCDKLYDDNDNNNQDPLTNTQHYDRDFIHPIIPNKTNTSSFKHNGYHITGIKYFVPFVLHDLFFAEQK